MATMIFMSFIVITLWKNIDKSDLVGVAKFIEDIFEYTIRSDLRNFDEHIEYVFIEISNDALTINIRILSGSFTESLIQI